MKRLAKIASILFVLWCLRTGLADASEVSLQAPLEPVYFQRVKIDGFWRAQFKRLTEKWIPHCIRQMEAGGVGQELLNLVHTAKALKGEPHGQFTGRPWSDAYVYNTIESICLALAIDPQGDEELADAQELLRAKMEQWVPIILAAQCEDGYIHSFHIVNKHPRYSNIRWHEFYVQGYFLEMGVAHYRITGGSDRRLYNAAIRCADHLCQTFGPAPKRVWIHGHAGMGYALCRLARLVNEAEGPGRGDKYSQLAKYLLDTRHTVEEHRSAYHQSHRPVVEMTDAVGHAGNGWFSYELEVKPDADNVLLCTYWGSDTGNRRFEILVDGRKIAHQTLNRNKPGEFFDVEVTVPEELTRGKSQVTVKAQADAGATAGGVFDLRTLRTHKIQSGRIRFDSLPSPVLMAGDADHAYRDPAVVYHGGLFHMFYTYNPPSETDRHVYWHVAVSTSRDLRQWTAPRTLTPKDQRKNFSSPGNVVRQGDEWILCMQSYPIPGLRRGDPTRFGDATARLYLMRSRDLRSWTEPELLRVKGKDIAVDQMGRMIDPFLLRGPDERWWCFYKQNGASRSWSWDLRTWTYDGRFPCGENVCIVPDGKEYVLFHSPHNGVGVKRSRDLRDWRQEGLLLLGQKDWPWARGRLTAGFVLDLRHDPTVGKALMFFHASGHPEAAGGFYAHASIGFAWSDDLRSWDWVGRAPNL